MQFCTIYTTAGHVCRATASLFPPRRRTFPFPVKALAKRVRRALRRTGISAPTEGAHLFRHSAATNLLREGVSLSAIGALLRHASIETTTVYAKVDVGLLSEIVMPWPESSSC